MSAIVADIIARFGIRIAIGLGVVVAFVTWDNSRINKGRLQERAAVEERSKTNARKAEAARRDADKLPPGRVFDRHCRDC